MGLKGNLSNTTLAEIFQTLSTGSSTGLLKIQAPEGPRFVELQNGVISIAGRSAGRVMLGDLLVSRGLIDDGRLDEALRLQKETGKLLGEVLLQSGAVTIEQLENALRFQIEEEVCELFTLKSGDFDFLDGAGLDSRMAPAGGLVRVNLDLAHLMAEAARRAEEWTTIEQRIPSQNMLFETTAAGDELLKGGQGVSPEGMILLRLAKTHRTVEAMVQKACLGRFTTNSMLLELWDAGIVEPAPLGSYERAAKEHLRLNRYDEAQRLADLLKERGNDDEKKIGKELHEEIAKSRKPVAPTTSSAYVKADPKVRSEVIRRNAPGLILKREKSYTPVVIISVVLIGGIGVGAYLLTLRGKGGESTKSRQQLEQLAGVANAYIVDGKYRESLELLRDFKSFDPVVQKQVNELFEKKQRDIEALLMKGLEEWEEAKKSGKTEDIEKVATKIEPLLAIGVMDPNLERLRSSARAEVNQRRDRKRSEQLETRLKEIEATEKPKGSDALLKAYQTLLAEDPPESIGAKLRDSILQLRTAKAETAALLTQARVFNDAGDLEMARLVFNRAKDRGAADADKAIEQINATIAASQAEFEKIQPLITQNKAAEAQAALTKFLETKPPHHIWERALLALHTFSGAENELASSYKAAAALWEKQPDEARKKIVELIEKNPLSATAASATLKLKVSSQPEGASVQLNGKPVGTTPAVLDVPALGIVHLSFTKEGFRAEDVLKNNLRDESISVPLDKSSAAAVLLPAPASSMIVVSDHLILSGEREIVMTTRSDLKVKNRIRIAGAEAEKVNPRDVPAPSVAAGEVFIPRGGAKTIIKLPLPKTELQRISLEQPPLSSPVFFNSVMAVATGGGFESFDEAKGSSLKRVKLGDAGPIGAAFDGTLMFLPRKGGALVAIAAADSLRKWDVNPGGEISGPPAFLASANVVVVATTAGRVVAYEHAMGGEKWKQELNGESATGVQVLASGFFVAVKGKAQLLAGDSGNSVWSVPLSGDAELTPLAIGNKAIAVCTQEGTGADSKHILYVLAADNGALILRKKLDSAPTAIASDDQRVYISTADAMLMAFELK